LNLFTGTTAPAAGVEYLISAGGESAPGLRASISGAFGAKFLPV